MEARADQLARLIAEQRADDARQHVRRRYREIGFTDLGVDPHASGWVSTQTGWQLIAGPSSVAWDACDEPFIKAECPACRKRRLRPFEYCLRCDRCGFDGKVTYPGLPVGSAMDPHYRGKGTKYVPGRLKGGR